MKNLKLTSIFIGMLALTAAQFTYASPATDAMLAKLKKTYPNIAFTEVNETPVDGIYEAVFGKDMLFVEASGTYFFPTMVNMATKKNLGDERRAELNKINFADLPFQDAVKTVHGTGKRKLAVFADPNCGYCKKLDGVLAGMKDVTIYTFALGILGPDSVSKATSVNCATGDKAKLWRSMMLEGGTPVEKVCNNGMTERNLELFKRYGFQGTPAIVLETGVSIKGYAEVARIEELMAKK